jgi:alkylation response protein AidB-like acyl-CoA dehydrogenase
MAEAMRKVVTEEESRRVAEEAREQKWRGASFIKSLFLGRLRWDLVYPFPEPPPPREEFLRFYQEMKRFLETEVDSVKMDAEGKYDPQVVEKLKKMGAFGMKIPKDYGGLGFTQTEYTQILELIAQYDGNLVALLSAHQSIGVPQPLKLFGTKEQKEKYLPRCARGAISAFALTEPDVGSDPARLSTTAEPTPDGKYYILNGEKLWCTNGTFAELFVVMARNPQTQKISAFIVEANWEGVEVVTRCHFMGLRAIENGVIRFRNVRVPRENLIGREGEGLKIALITLNTGRLSLPAACVGVAKRALQAVREWSKERVQWGVPIGKHEAIAIKLADIGATTLAMESVHLLSNRLAELEGYDIRLEAAAAKEWNSTRQWQIIDDAMQIRGGRGYETEASLKNRGEKPYPIERAMRDTRINRIFEGSSEIMHLFMAREAVDNHLQVAGVLIDPRKGLWEKIKALPRILLFYLSFYPRLYFGFTFLKYWGMGKWGRVLRFAERATRRLAREVFHGMLLYQAKLEKRQAFLFRAVDIAMEIYALVATVSRVKTLLDRNDPRGKEREDLAEIFFQNARRNIRRWFYELWHNDDSAKVRVSQSLLNDAFLDLERGTVPLPEEAPSREPRIETRTRVVA